MTPEIVAILKDLVEQRGKFQGCIVVLKDSHVRYGETVYARVERIEMRYGDVIVTFSGVGDFPLPREMFWPTESRVFTNPASGARHLDQGRILVEGGCCGEGGCMYLFTTKREVDEVPDPFTMHVEDGEAKYVGELFGL